MKNILKYFMPCMVTLLALTSCYDTMDDKAGIDAQNNGKFATPTIMSASATATAYNAIEVVVTVDDANTVAEQGVQVSSSSNFTTDDYFVSTETADSYTITVDGLEESTTYYYRAYVMGKNGTIVYGDTQTITTPEAPKVPVDGVYTTLQYSYDYDSEKWIPAESTYKITIEFDEGDEEVVNITNIWNKNTTVKGIYDKETNVITVPSSQFIIWDSPYGKLTLVGMTPEADDFTETITFTFNPGGGAMKSSNWECVFIEGDYQGYTWGNGNYLVMQHD